MLLGGLEIVEKQVRDARKPLVAPILGELRGQRHQPCACLRREPQVQQRAHHPKGNFRAGGVFLRLHRLPHRLQGLTRLGVRRPRQQ